MLTGDLADDLLLLKSDPIEVDDISPEATVNHGRLGPTARRWATLWRELFGLRLGIHSVRPKVKGKVPGSVLEELGISKSFLESAIGDRGQQYNNRKYGTLRT